SPHGHVGDGDGGALLLDALGLAAVDGYGGDGRVVRAQLGGGDVDDLLDLLGRAAQGAHGEEDRGAEVRGRAPVEGELGRAGDVGVVRADDDDDVAALLDGVEALDDPGEGGRLVGVDVVVGDADAVLVGEVDAVVGQEQ